MSELKRLAASNQSLVEEIETVNDKITKFTTQIDSKLIDANAIDKNKDLKRKI